jgi:hypothetical protein
LGSKPPILGKRANVNTFPANRHSATGCRLDTSLLSAGQQGAERRSARKVTTMQAFIAFAAQKFVLIKLAHLAHFVQFCEDFRSKMFYFQLFFVSLYTICPMLGENN